MQIEEAKLIRDDIINNDQTQEDLALTINDLQAYCHGAALASGWWHDKKGMPIEITKDVIGMKIALMHSELSEALEGLRKDLKDDHLPHFDMVTVEFADTIIRILDTAGAMGLNIGDALAGKLRYNMTRADHKPENRFAPGGKSI